MTLDTLPVKLNTFDFGMLAEVDAIIMRSVSAGDPLIACEYGLQLQQSARMKGVALAKLLHGLQVNWDIFKAAGIEDDFEPFMEAQMDVAPVTSRKYINMWNGIFLSPFVSDHIKAQLQTRPIEHLLLLTAAVREGSLNEADLKEAVLYDKQGIREMVNEARGTKTSASVAISLGLQMTDGKYPKGTLVAQQNGNKEVVGYLKLDPETDFGQKIIERIKNLEWVLER